MESNRSADLRQIDNEMGHLAKQRDASFFRVFFNPYHYGVLTEDLVKRGVEYFNTVEISSKRNNLTTEDYRNEAA